MKVEDEKQMKKTQPMLQQQINKTANALSNCLQAKSAATAWYVHIYSCYFLPANQIRKEILK
jgi:hypothetical protein